MSIVEWFTNNPVVSAWVTIISLIGVIVTITAFIAQMKDRRKKTLCYTVSSSTLLNDKISKIDGVEVFYQGTPIKSISASTINIWNAGNEIVYETDFYSNKELKILIPKDEQILGITEINEVADTSKSKISLTDKSELSVQFYCYEPKQGVSFIIYHTCVSKKAVVVDGKIKAGKLANKSVEIIVKNGKFYIETPQYRISIDNALFRFPLTFLNIFGISTKRKQIK